MTQRPRLLFVSPRFLLPADSGGKIRTTEVLRNLKGGTFEVTLACPASAEELERYGEEVAGLTDRTVTWSTRAHGRFAKIARLRYLMAELPISVATDRSAAGGRTVAALLRERPAVAVFDFVHSAVLAPRDWSQTAAVLFTHNVEAQIFERHMRVAADPLRRYVWRSQFHKMQRFERAALHGFHRVIAVSHRDREAFMRDHQVADVSVIPTGVNLNYFRYTGPAAGRGVMFIGSMDWLANIDAVELLMNDVWPGVAARLPDAEMTIVGRSPPEHLVRAARARGLRWTFTGRVEDVRLHAAKAAACVIPLRVGGGTRIKTFEAMAMGIPVVATSIAVEGLAIDADRHYLRGDTAAELSDALVRVLSSPSEARRMAERARAHVEAHFSNAVVGRCFEAICLEALAARRVRLGIIDGARPPWSVAERRDL